MRHSKRSATLRDAIIEQLRRRPITEDELLDVLLARDVDLGPDPETALEVALESTELAGVTILSDDRLVFAPAVLAGRTFTHRVTSAELRHDMVSVMPDLMPLWCIDDIDGHNAVLAASDDGAAQPTGEVLRAADPTLTPELLNERGVPLDDADEDGVFLLPSGSLRGIGVQPGGLMGLRVAEGGVEVVRVDEPAATSARALGERLDAVLAADPEEQPHELETVVLTACADDPELFTVAQAPLSEAIESAELAQHGDWLARAGFDFDQSKTAADIAAIMDAYDLDDDQAFAVLALGSVHQSLTDWFLDRAEDAGDGEIPDFTPGGDVPPPLSEAAFDILFPAAQWLSDPAVATAFARIAHHSGDAGAACLGTLADMLVEILPAEVQPALQWLRATAFDRVGNIAEAEAALRAAEALNRRWPPALVDLARYASDRGDATGALALLQRAKDDPQELTGLLRQMQPTPRPDVGRNHPCWCGSGKKYKLCHLPKENVPLEERVRWLYNKAEVFLVTSDWRHELVALAEIRSRHWSDSEAMVAALQDPLVSDALLFEGGAFEDFLETRGSLLPDDERLLAQQWLLVDRSVFEVEGIDVGHGLTCRDVRTGDVEEIREVAGSRQLKPGDLICCRVVPAGETTQIFGGVEPVSLMNRDKLVELLDSEPEPAELVAFLSARFAPPEMRNTEGEPLVFHETQLQVCDPDALADELDEFYDRDEPDEADRRWFEYVTTDGMLRIRATLTLDGDVLTVGANSEARLQRVLDVVADLDPSVTLIGSSRQPASEMMTAARGDDAEPPDTLEPDDPAIAAALAEFIRGYEKSWLDQSIPALAGLTPREAAADPTRRDDLVRLLDSFPTDAGQPGMMDPDRLRRELGLA